jgi:hypothetical protein
MLIDVLPDGGGCLQDNRRTPQLQLRVRSSVKTTEVRTMEDISNSRSAMVMNRSGSLIVSVLGYTRGVVKKGQQSRAFGGFLLTSRTCEQRPIFKCMSV